MDVQVETKKTVGFTAGTMDLNNEEIASLLLGEVDAWANTYAIERFAGFHKNIVVKGARLYAIPWVELRTRIEKRSLSQETRPYRSGDPYQPRTVDAGRFPLWSYTLRQPGQKTHFGVAPATAKVRVAHSDTLLECDSCGAAGSIGCGTCEGDGVVLCTKCKGGRKITCKSCSGHGQKNCQFCFGRGEIHCRSCTDGIAHGERCRNCSGRTFHKCDECQNGFQNCQKCLSKGEVNCPTCNAQGCLGCAPCSGAGELICDNCRGSGELINSLYLSSSESDVCEAAYVTPPEFDADIPEDVVKWARTSLTVWELQSTEAERFTNVPLVHADQKAKEKGQELIDAAWRRTSWKSDAGTFDLSKGGFGCRINWQRYRENYLPLMQLEYTFEGRDYRLWCASPCVTEHSSSKHSTAGAHFFRNGSSVYTRTNPIQEYLDDLAAEARANLKRGELKEAERLVNEVAQSTPNNNSIKRLREQILEAQNHSAAAAAAIAVGIGLCLYFMLSSMDVIRSLSGWSVFGRFTGLLLCCLVPCGLPHLVFARKSTAKRVSFVGAALLFVLAFGV